MEEVPYPSFAWHAPTRVIFGVGVLSRLGELVRETAGAKGGVFLVTGRRSLRGLGRLDVVLRLLGDRPVVHFDGVAPFPSPETADAAARECRRSGAEVVVAVGGGSALDVGKAAAFLSTREGSALDYVTGDRPVTGESLPFIAVPTTSGSSSEVTPSAALWDRQAGRHYTLGGPAMFPATALVDPQLSMSMDASLAANSGWDALTSAIEAFWSVQSSPLSDALALEAIALFRRDLVRSVIQGDLESRTTCALAATVSGLAYSNSRPNACHAVGSPLTLRWNVAHGQAVAVTLPAFLRWNARAIAHKSARLWGALGVRDVDEAVALLETMMDRCGIQRRLSSLGPTASEVDAVVEGTRWDLMERLPRSMSRQDLRELLLSLL